MYLMCAWMCDDAGEDALAAMYRTKAIDASKESLGDKTLKAADRFWRRRLQWIIARNLGRDSEALKGMTDLHAEIEQFIKARRKTLPPKPEGFDNADGKMPYKLRNSDEDHGGLFEPDKSEKPLHPKTKARLRKIWKAWLDFDELESVARSIKYRKTLWLYKTLRATKALALAMKGKYTERYVFTELFRSSNDFRIIAGIKAFVAKPLGERPKSSDSGDWMFDEMRGSNKLRDILMYRSGTSAELHRFAKSYASSDVEDENAPSLTDLMLKRASPEFLVKRLKDKQHGFYVTLDGDLGYLRPDPFGGSDTAVDIVAELVRRQDADAIAALTADFAENLSCYAEKLDDLREEVFPETKKHPMERDFSWAYPTETTDYFEPFYRAIARDPKLAAEAASGVIYRAYTDEDVPYADGVVGIMPLGYVKTEESRKLLIEASGMEEPAMAYAAAKCLLLRGDPAGKDAMINVILTHQLWDLPRDRAGDAFIGMLKDKDATVLPKLKKLFLDNPEYTRLLAKNEREVNGLGLPIRLVAALTRAEPKQQGIYDAFLARFAPPAEAPKDGSWASHFDYRHIDSLAQAARMYYRPDIGKHIARLLDRFADDEIAPMLIDALAAGGAADQLGTLAALLKRSVPIPVKAALIRASRKLDIPGMAEKLTEWSRSRNGQLAKLAKAEIARRDKTPKQQ